MIRIILLLTLSSALAQDSNCDYTRNVQVNRTYYVSSPDYPSRYTAGVQCRWQATCPTGYNCNLTCSEFDIPSSPSCSLDRLLVSKSGDPQLASAQTYCGRGSFSALSSGHMISIGLIASNNSTGGRFLCNLSAQEKN